MIKNNESAAVGTFSIAVDRIEIIEFNAKLLTDAIDNALYDISNMARKYRAYDFNDKDIENVIQIGLKKSENLGLLYTYAKKLIAGGEK